MTVLSDYWPLIVLAIVVTICTTGEIFDAIRQRRDDVPPRVLVPVVNWRSMHSAPKDREFWALSDDMRGNDLPPFVSKCRWHPSAGFCTDELREPIMWRPL